MLRYHVEAEVDGHVVRFIADTRDDAQDILERFDLAFAGVPHRVDIREVESRKLVYTYSA